jgi:thiamine-phosphate pyrophosphorylase
MSFYLPKVYPLTDVSLTGLSHAEQIRRLAAGGASIVQLREKTMSAREFYTEAQAALFVARETGIQLIINDRVDIALALHADGVHLGQDDLPPAAARALLGPNAIIGLSTHNVDQAIRAQLLPIDYVAIGPIFSTTTKIDTDPELGIKGFGEIRKAVTGLPLVAIGGLSAGNALEVIKAGADSVAVVSALLADPLNIASRTGALIRAL